MKLVWSRHAVGQLAEIREYIARDKPGAAAHVAGRIREAVSLLKRHPHLGKRGLLPGTRELVVPGMPFVIAYRIRQRTVEIIAVHHGAQRRETSD